MNRIISSVVIENLHGEKVVVPANLCCPVRPTLMGRLFNLKPKIEFVGSNLTRQQELMTHEYYEKVFKIKVGEKYKIEKFYYSLIEKN